MPASTVEQANPPPKPSAIPDEVLQLAHKRSKGHLHAPTYHHLQAFRNAADYIAAAMIFLRGNCLLEESLHFADIKPRLLGHWGTCPGLTIVYAHLNHLIQKHDLDVMYVVGPGHGAPAILACLWLEGSLERFYPQYTRDREGLDNLITKFSTPSGFPSHINAETPGSIHEGGELGYALSVAFGAVMDKPDLIVCAVIGDGEAETGPTAGAWHGYKYIDPKESGAVLPVIHVNGFKISERTIYGCMDDKELVCLFTGYGYRVRFVEDLDDIDSDMFSAMEWALREIKEIQHAARNGIPVTKPRWPLIILRSPKGWGCPKEVNGQVIEGSFRAHQVPLPKAGSELVELRALKMWLESYNPETIFDHEGYVSRSILEIIPKTDFRKLGQNPRSYNNRKPLIGRAWKDFSVGKGEVISSLSLGGKFLDRMLVDNPKTLRIFSPDELVSNKLDAVFEHTGRNFQWDEASAAKGGRVVEILSEHTCQGFMQGYTMTGRTGIFPSYESFLGIISTMMVQYSKFNKRAREVPWRGDTSSLNYIETSTWTRQEHNGFSHQNPGFIGTVLDLQPNAARVYLPPDANCFLSTLAHCLRSKNYVNLIVASKIPGPAWLSPIEADTHCRAGASVWKFASTDEGLDPDVVLVGIGCEVNFEVLKAAAYLRRVEPALRVRVVNVTDLMVLGRYHPEGHPHALDDAAFDILFTADKPIHFNYHGYRNELQGLLFGRPNLERVSIEGYREEGSTTTPFDMLLRNHVSRYHVAEAAIRGAARQNPRVALRMQELLGELQYEMKKIQDHVWRDSEDPKGTFDVPDFINFSNGDELKA